MHSCSCPMLSTF